LTHGPEPQVTGLGWPNYWKSGWNRFDFLLVASSIADMLVSLVAGAEVRALKIQKVMRLMRLARVVKLLRGMKVRGWGRGALAVNKPAVIGCRLHVRSRALVAIANWLRLPQNHRASARCLAP
jgi:hypothetical protein